MGIMSDVTTQGANSTSANLMSGKIGEFVERPSSVRVGIVAAAVGMFGTVIIGGNVLLDDQEVSAANRFPTDPDDIVVEVGAVPGDQIVVRIRNSTGAGIVTQSLVKTIALG